MSDRLALVIEDDFDASVIFAKALEVIGFKTEVIASGDKALARLKEVAPDMIVLDLHLPEVLGTDILRFIRSQERLALTKVIIASADPRSAETIQDQADLVLIKPTTFSQVRDFAKRLADAPAKRRTSEVAKPVDIKPAEEEESTQKTAQATVTKPAETAEADKPESTQNEAAQD
ncbi:MAG: response regulator [Anaerolineae bacterium]|nr:response regulator [Anaerolineae bacterium]